MAFNRILLPALLLTAATAAQAATRTACFDMKIADERIDCATSVEAGNRRGCQQGAHIWPVGHLYEAWDKDDDGSDELIGTWLIAGTGTRCITFEWESASYSKGETNPDVFLKYINKVRKTSVTGARVVGVTTLGGAAANTSWRTNAVATNCAAAATCYILPTGYMIPTTDAFSERGGRLMALDSAQHALEVYGDLMELDVDLHFPGSGSNSFATSRTEFHIASGQEDSGITATHELGHVLQMQLFNQDSLRDDCGGSHSLTGVELQSCATTEGWAGYAGAVAWWDPNNNSADPVWWGNFFEPATPIGATLADNAGIEMQVARAFWDLDDTDNTDVGVGLGLGDEDLMAYSSTYVAEGWMEFADGTANHDDFETNTDGHAVNVRDYIFNNSARFSASLEETLLRHNALDSQVSN